VIILSRSFFNNILPSSADEKLFKIFSNSSKVFSSIFILKYLQIYLKGCCCAFLHIVEEQRYVCEAVETSFSFGLLKLNLLVSVYVAVP